MGQRKFNIFKKKYNDSTNVEEKVEVLLDKNKKYKLDRQGNLVEYDDIVIEQEKEAKLQELEVQKASLTDVEYETQKKTIEQDSSLERVVTEAADDELIFTGSKSDIRKGEIAERNVTVLATTKVDVDNLRYDIAFFSPSEQPMNETLLCFVSPVELDIDVNLSTDNGSSVHFVGYVEEAYVIDVKHNDVNVGTIVIEIDGSTTITVPQIKLNKGDRLSYHAPDVFESELKDVSITVAANQSVK